MNRIACIHFPQWPIQRLVASRPELRFQRVVLFEHHPQRGQIVACASPRALQSGVRPGIPVTEARSLLRRHSSDAAGSVHVLPYEPRVDETALMELARSLDAFSPIVGIDTQPPSDSLLLDLTGLAPLFDGEANLVARLQRHLDERQWVARIAVADTLGAAWALAHFAPTTNGPVIVDGDGCHSDEPDGSPLDALPPAAMRIDPATCETLRQLGLNTIGLLRQIPASSLNSRFGDTITHLLQQAHGAIPETFPSVPRGVQFSAEQILDYPVREQETVLEVLKRLIVQLCGELATIRQGALAWHVRIKRSEASPIHLRVGLFQASSRIDQIMPLVKMQLEQHRQFDGLNHPVEEISVTASGCVLLVEQQGQLFEDSPRKNENALGELLNRLAIRLGEDQVVSATVVAGAEPERATTFRPLVGPRSVRPRQSHRKVTEDVMNRPTRLLPRPIELHTDSTAAIQLARSESQATVADNTCSNRHSISLPRVFRFTSNNTPFSVTRSWGPERIETGWWRGRTLRRDYWRIEIDSGAQLWIYRDLRSGRWYLHGAF
jgi:protein ImuB